MASDFEKFMQALVGGLGAGMGSYARSREQRKEAEERKRLEEESVRQYEEGRAADKAKEERLATQYQGQRITQLEESGRTRVKMPQLTGDPGSMAAYGAAAQGKTFMPDLKQWWEPLKPEPSAEEKMLAEADVLLKFIDKMNESAQPGMGWSGTSYQPLPGYGQEAGGDALGLKPVDWDRFYDNATKMTYAKYGISEGVTPPDIDWDAVNAEIMETARTLAQPFLGDPLKNAASSEARSTAREIAIAWAEADPETMAALPELQRQYPEVYALAAKYKRDLDRIEQAETITPPGMGSAFAGPQDMAGAGSSYALPAAPPQPGRGWRTIEEILGG